MSIESVLSHLRPILPAAPEANPDLAATRTTHDPRCARCGQLPEEIEEYPEGAADEFELDLASMSAKDVREAARAHARADGTFNHAVGSFYCTACYIEAGQPLGKAP